MALHPSLLTSAAIPAIGPDADIIAACNAFAEQEIIAQTRPDDYWDNLSSAEWGKVDPERDACYERLFAFRATTPEGFRARARAVALYLYPDTAGEWHWEQVGALLRDMLGLPEPEPVPEEEPRPPPPRDRADPSENPMAAPWRQQFPLMKAELPDVGVWVQTAIADLPILRLAQAWQTSPMDDLVEAFEAEPDVMAKTAADMLNVCERYEPLAKMIKGEAIRYGLAQLRAQRPAGGAA